MARTFDDDNVSVGKGWVIWDMPEAEYQDGTLYDVHGVVEILRGWGSDPMTNFRSIVKGRLHTRTYNVCLSHRGAATLARRFLNEKARK